MTRFRQKELQYTKLELSKFSDEDTNTDEDTELLVRKPIFKEIPTEEKTIQDGDTLQSLSLRFQCSIAELKRLNNIHKENEIYARNTIKVPLRPFSKILAAVHTSGKSSPDISTAQRSENVDGDVLERKLTDLNKEQAASLNAVIFNSNIIANTCDKDEESTEDEQVCALLTTQSHSPDASSTFSCSGADADISWIALIVFICILIVVVPLIYVLYIAEHPEEYHHKAHLN